MYNLINPHKASLMHSLYISTFSILAFIHNLFPLCARPVTNPHPISLHSFHLTTCSAFIPTLLSPSPSPFSLTVPYPPLTAQQFHNPPFHLLSSPISIISTLPIPNLNLNTNPALPACIPGPSPSGEGRHRPLFPLPPASRQTLEARSHYSSFPTYSPGLGKWVRRRRRSKLGLPARFIYRSAVGRDISTRIEGSPLEFRLSHDLHSYAIHRVGA